MKIVIIGGTGLIGSQVVQNLRSRGHEAVPASPDTGVNTITGEGLDAALVLSGGKGRDAALEQMKRGGRVAYPNGVDPEPEAAKGVTVRAYDGNPEAGVFDRLNELISKEPFHVEVSFYPLEEAAQAHRDLAKHHLGKLALRMR